MMQKLICLVLLLGTTGCGAGSIFVNSLSEEAQHTPIVTSDMQFINAFGGEELTVTGFNLFEGAKVEIEGQVCSNVQVTGSYAMKLTTPGVQKIGEVQTDIYQGTRLASSSTTLFKSYAVYGQPSVSVNEGMQYGLHTPFQAKVCGGKLFVLDTSNNRIKVYNNAAATTFGIADYILGDKSYSGQCNGGATVDRDHFCNPYGMACTDTKLVVADSQNHRLLIWNTLPEVAHTQPDVVLGQNDFVTRTANFGSLSASSLFNPSSVAIDKNGRLYSGEDSSNARVLIWDAIPTVNFEAADHLVGQTSFTASTATVTQTRIANALSILTVDDKLLVADGQNRRVLIWDALPTGLGAAANHVIGQPDFTTNTAGVSDTKFGRITGLASDGTKLIVVDNGNNRLAIFNSIPGSNLAAADLQIGQTDFSTNTANNGGLSASSLSGPHGASVAVVGGQTKLFVADISNNRVLVWNAIPTASTTPANLIVGQSSFTASGIDTPLSHIYNLGTVRGVYYAGDELMIADSSYNRVLIWRKFPASLETPPDVILGQSDINGKSANAGGSASASTLRSPRNVWKFGNRIYVADSGNHRVLIWDALPTANMQAANVVLGQPDFTTVTSSTGGISPTSMFTPSAALVVDGKLYVADSNHHRVLIFSSAYPATGEAAVGVLGQANFTTGTANQGAIAANRMNYPVSLASNGTQLAVADILNNRVLIWNALPASLSSADLVLGQPSMAANTANNAALTGAAQLSNPVSVFYTERSLYVSDRGNSRVLTYDLATLASQAQATSVFGQTDLNSMTANFGTGINRFSLNSPESVQVFSAGMVIADQGNRRVVFHPF